MSDPLKGLKPTPGPVTDERIVEKSTMARDWRTIEPCVVAPSSFTRWRDGEPEEVVGVRIKEADALLIVDAFNTYTATDLAPSQLAKALADEKALTEELRSQRDELVKASARALEMISFAELCVGDCQPGIDNHKAGCGELAIRTALARVKGGTR